MSLLPMIALLLLVAVASFTAGIFAVLWWAVPRIERGYIFRPNKIVAKTPADAGIPFEQHFIRTPDGCRLSAWHMSPTDPLGSVVYFHGNGANLGILNEIFVQLYRAGLQVLAVDYRGYGWSDGAPSEEGLRLDAETTVEYFRAKLKAPNAPLIYWGRSLGSCFAAWAAGKSPPQGLILESAFPNKTSLLKHYRQFRAFGIFSRCRLDTARYLRGHRFPVLLVHGDKDTTIPMEQGRMLYEALTGPKEFFHIQGADHINLHRVDGEGYIERVLRFVEDAKPPTIH